MPRPPNIPSRKILAPAKLSPKEVKLNNLVKQGFALHQQEKYDEAIAIYEQILVFEPSHFEALQLIGALYKQTKQSMQAIHYLSKALSINSNHWGAQYNLANTYKDLNRLDDALACFDKIITIKPDSAEAFTDRALVLKGLMRYQEALENYDKAIALKPDLAVAFYNRAEIHIQYFRFEEAIADYDKSISINPNFADALQNKGIVLQKLLRLEEAAESLKKAININPSVGLTHTNLGIVLQELHRTDEALSCHKKALEIAPNLLQGHWNLSICNLLAGNFEEGWKGYEWRWQIDSMKPYKRNFIKPLWLGVESLKDKTILLHAEQGLGDTIQFCRYAALFEKLGATVILEVQGPLKELLKDLEGVSKVIAKGERIPSYDYHTPLLSLPLAFSTDLQSIPEVPHNISIDAGTLEKWNIRLGQKTKPRVGIVWFGSTIHAKAVYRSVPLSQLLQYLPAGIDYFSLQKDIMTLDEFLLAERPEIQHFGKELNDFTDTAALCELMDVVISVDTSVAHLAGTLNKPTCLLLPFSPDWRWLLGRDDSPWYSSFKLYRQEKIDDWDGLLENLQVDLEKIK